jgi:hypothetical protein
MKKILLIMLAMPMTAMAAEEKRCDNRAWYPIEITFPNFRFVRQ